MISQIEAALIDRLSRGLGKMVYAVSGYAGEINEKDLDIRRLPACLVSYGGSAFEAKSTGVRGKRFKTSDIFVVLVITRSMRNATAGRLGGVNAREIGVNTLLSAVKRLLINQTLGDLVEPIVPKRIRTIWNNAKVNSEKLSAYALEFEIRYTEPNALEDGLYPEGSADKASPEWVFSHYQGQLSAPVPELKTVSGQIFDPMSEAAVPFVVRTEE